MKLKHKLSTIASAIAFSIPPFAAMCLALAMLTASSPAVAAKRVPAGGDYFQQGCRSLQDAILRLLAEYKRVAESSDPNRGVRMRELIVEMQNITGDWKSIGCQDSWGDIVRELPRPPRPPRPGQEQLPVPVPVPHQKADPPKQPTPPRPEPPHMPVPDQKPSTR